MSKRRTAPPADHKCDRCGEVHPGCTAHNRAGKPCGLKPRTGFLVCRLHGAESPRAKAGAEARLAEAKAAALAARWAVPVETNPVDAVLEQIKWSAGHVTFYRSQVDALDTADMVWGQTKEKRGGDDWGSTYEAQQSAWLALYNAERDRLVKFCSEAIRAGIEERKVRLAEQQGEIIVRLLDGILTELGHNPADPKTAGIVERHLRLVEGDSQ